MTGAAALALLAATGVYRHLTEPTRLRRLVIGHLETLFAADVQVMEAGFSLKDGLRLTGLALADRHDSAAQLRPILTCRELIVRPSYIRMLRGRFQPTSITAQELTCRAIFDADTGRFDLHDLLAAAKRRGGSRSSAWPRLHLQSTHVELLCREAGAERFIEALDLDIEAAPVDPDGQRYGLRWSAPNGPAVAGRVEVDRAAGRIVDRGGGTPWLTVETAEALMHAAGLAGEFDTDQLGIAGRVRLVDFDLDCTDGPDNRGALEFADTAVSVPLDAREHDLPPAERYLQLTGAAGRIAMSPRGGQGELHGQIVGAACTVRARCTPGPAGWSDWPGCGLELEAEAVDLALPRDNPAAAPAESRLINRWRAVRCFYNDFDPHGSVDLHLAVFKEAGATRLRLRQARMQARGNDAACRLFPYRVYNISGLVEADPSGVRLFDVGGEHDGGRVLVNGHLDGLEWHDPLVLDITGRDIPLDEALCDAITGPYRAVWEQFQPRGVADIDVVLHRPASTGGMAAKLQTRIAARVLAAEAEFTRLPCPVHDISGPIIIEGDRLTAPHLRGRSGEATIEVSARASYTSDGPRALDVQLAARDVRLDDQVRAALPGAARAQLDRVDARGRLDLTGTVTLAGPQQPLDYVLDMNLDNAELCPPQLPAPLTNIAGRICLTPAGAELLDVQATCACGQVSITGRVEGTPEPIAWDLDVAATGLQLAEEHRSAWPAALSAALQDWEVAGNIDLAARLQGRADGRGEEPAYTGVIQATGATVRHRTLPLPATNLSGTLQFRPGNVDIHDVTADWCGGRLALAGQTGRDLRGLRTELSATLTEAAFAAEMGAALPPGPAARWAAVNPRGRFSVELSRLICSRPFDSAAPQWDFAGRLHLRDADLELGTRIRGLRGTLDFAAGGRGDLDAVSVLGDLDISRVHISRYDFTDLHGRLVRDGPGDRWLARDLSASLYGGTVHGELEVDTSTSPAGYGLESVVADMDVQTFINARRQARGAPPVSAAGLLDGRLYLYGGGYPAEQRGGGRFAVREAELYRLPLILSISSALGRDPPREPAGQQAAGEFFLRGDELTFRDLIFRAPGLLLSGHGNMDNSTENLDLHLVASVPDWARVPVLTEMLTGTCREIVQVEVSGSPSAPEVQTRPLPGLRGAVDQFVVPRTPRRAD